jgi:hypothetical protein
LVEVTTLNEFSTGLVVPRKEALLRERLKGKGWEVHFAPLGDCSTGSNGNTVLILAKTWEKAHRSLDLILDSLILCHGELFNWPVQLTVYNAKEPKNLPSHLGGNLEDQSFSTPGIVKACEVAVRASRANSSIYAITKYAFSMKLFSVYAIDQEPFRSDHIPISSFPKEHIAFANAIINAYAALEDLGLELRASHAKPSRVNNEWNPLVKRELEDRLKAKSVNYGEPLIWVRRSANRKIEKKRDVPSANRCPWKYGNVRDCEIELVDAIAYADWLRDRVASHGFKGLMKRLSPYDVVNVQHLTRRLILEYLDFWHVMKSESEEEDIPS